MKSKILDALPLDELLELARKLLGAGVSRDVVIDELVALADRLVDWRTIVRGLGGELLEAADGPVARAVIGVIVVLAERLPKAG